VDREREQRKPNKPPRPARGAHFTHELVDRAAAHIAPQWRDLREHAELIQAVVRRSEKGAVSPAHDAADELALDGKRDYPYPTVRGIMRIAVKAGQVETYAPGRWRFTPAGLRLLASD
jgi:hypothetical protein